MTDPFEEREYLKLVVSTCQAMIDRQTSFILGTRQLRSLSFSLKLDYTKDALTLTAIDSETDSLPLGQERQYWNEDALRRLEPEIVKAEKWAYEVGVDACSGLRTICEKRLQALRHEGNNSP